MSQNGYQKFFKEAMKNSSSNKVNRPNPAAPVGARRKFVTAEELNLLVSQNLQSKKEQPAVLQRRVPRGRKSKPLAKGMIVISFIGLILAAGALCFDEELEKKFSHIDIEFFGMTAARAEKSEATPAAANKDNHADAKKTEAPADPKAAAKQVDGKTPAAGDTAAAATADKEKTEKTGVAAEADHLLTLAQRKKELDERDEELKQVESQVQEQKKELEKKIAELEETRRKIAALLEERVKIDDQKVDTLVQVYSTMRPPQAAKVFETMDEGLVVEILSRMKKKNAADVMNLIKAEKAQIFSEKIAGYRANK